MKQTKFLILYLLFSSIFRFIGINIFGANFYITFFLGLIFLIKSDFKINSKLLYFFLFAVPALFYSYLDNNLITLIYGSYEVITIFVIFFSIDQLKLNKLDINKVKFVVIIILLFYLIFGLVQALASAEISLLITKIISNSDTSNFNYVESNILAGNSRISLNFGVSTTASGFIFVLMFFYYLLSQIKKNKYDNLILLIGFLIIILTGTRHTIVVALILLLIVGLNKKQNILKLLIPLFLAILILTKIGYDNIVLERFSRGFDDNFNARFDTGLSNFSDFIFQDWTNFFFGNGPGKLYQLGAENWTDSGFVSNGLLLFHLNFGVLIYLFLWKSIKPIYHNTKSLTLFICLFLILISDNYSYFTHSVLFLLILNFKFLNLAYKNEYSTN